MGALGSQILGPGAIGPAAIIFQQARATQARAAEAARERRLTALGIGAIGAEAVGGLAETFIQAGAIGAAGRFQRQQLETGRRLAEFQARDAIRRGEREGLELRKGAKRLIGRQRAILAAQGIDVSTGSALDIQLESAELAAADALTIRNNAFREAMGFRIRAVEFGAQAQFERIAARAERRATFLTGGLRFAREAFRGAAFLEERGAI